VRTRNLQLLGSGSGTLTQQASPTTTNYTIVWPDTSAWLSAQPAGTQFFLRSSTGNTTTSNLTWFGVLGDLVDNNGNALGTADAGQVTYWADDNSITGEAGFLWNATANTLTIGQTGETAEIFFTDGTVTDSISINHGTAGNEFRFPDVPAGTVNIPVATNLPSGSTDDQILLSNIDGTATWTDNPFAGVQRGVATPTPGAFTHVITLAGTVTIDATDVILITSYDINATPSVAGNILAVTARSGATFTVSSTGPFTATEAIAWLFIPIP
jgi:hypothetical protein